jgi:tetratricopeptide (TPR) repeat protein
LQAADDAFARGNEAYAAGRYGDAIRDYESIVSGGRYSPALFFNLANSYYRDNKLGEAVLNYERALWLRPGDPDARANLRFARQTAGLFEPSKTWWEAVASWGSLNQWAWMAAISLIGLCAALVIWLLAPKITWRWVLKPIIVIAAVDLIVGSAALAIRLRDADRGVVLVQDAPLRVAPLEKSPAPSTLRVGDIVEIQNRRPPFYYIAAQDGKTGWVSDREMAPIIPGS